MAQVRRTPDHATYDVVIVGGAIMGAATAWFLTEQADFDGRVLVVERDMSFRDAATTHTTSCIRQQFSTELNVRISQFAADFINNLPANMGHDPRVPHLSIHSFGYMYLANDEAFAQTLRRNQAIQQKAGAATQLMTPDQIAAAYPFYRTDDLVLGSINLVNEGYWDAGAVNEWWRRQSQERGVEWVESEVVGITANPAGNRVTHITLSSGAQVSCGQLVNCAGARAAQVAQLAGITVPVEPRKRFSWVFKAERPLDRPLPLTIDPSGVHVRENGGGTYQCGGHAAVDPAVEPDDFAMDHALWQDHIWPVLAARIPQFEAIRVQAEWAGHYAMNTFDHNAIMGPHHRLTNFLFLNGFSGHGLQQAPAMGRGTAEYLTHGAYQTLDLSAFDHQRLVEGQPIVENAII